MLFSLDVMRARKGDCLMVHCGKKEDPRLIMIDGGPSKVYGNHLKPRIQQLRKARGLDAQEPLPVELLMVSHVDDDHIKGILDLTKELTTAQLDNSPQLVQVLNFWHNSFEDIIGHSPDELTAQFTAQFGAASMNGDPPTDLTLPGEEARTDREEEELRSTLKVLANIKQGAQLRNDARRLDFPLNLEFDGELIMAKKPGKKLEIVDDLRFTVVGPMLPELKALHKKHQAWLKELAKEGKTPEDVLSAYADPSVPNLSSIVVLAETGDASMLLTGDARGDKILEGLEFTGRLKKGGKMHVNLLKVPHHGSSNNVEDDFFERITADHYVFSGDGEHGNPERESLEMLLNARGDEKYTVHLTYPFAEIDTLRQADWVKEQNNEKKRKLKNPKQKVRANWSPKENSLTEFFKKNKAFAKKLQTVEAGKRHVIDLQDKTQF